MNSFSRKEGKGDDLKLQKSIPRKSRQTETTITSRATTTDRAQAASQVARSGRATWHGLAMPCGMVCYFVRFWACSVRVLAQSHRALGHGRTHPVPHHDLNFPLRLFLIHSVLALVFLFPKRL